MVGLECGDADQAVQKGDAWPEHPQCDLDEEQPDEQAEQQQAKPRAPAHARPAVGKGRDGCSGARAPGHRWRGVGRCWLRDCVHTVWRRQSRAATTNPAGGVCYHARPPAPRARAPARRFAGSRSGCAPHPGQCGATAMASSDALVWALVVVAFVLGVVTTIVVMRLSSGPTPKADQAIRPLAYPTHGVDVGHGAGIPATPPGMRPPGLPPHGAGIGGAVQALVLTVTADHLAPASRALVVCPPGERLPMVWHVHLAAV